ncbi:MAG: alcohol dehydrogenase catalytic domain-containing protein [Nitrososphaerota archaeon]
MKAAVYGIDGLNIMDVDKPKLSKNEVLIKVYRAGICGTDKAIVSGTYPIKKTLIIGHEFSGIIEEVSQNINKEIIGKKVVSEINIVCHNCYFCLKGEKTHCLNRKAIGIDIDGAFAEYIKVPFENIHFIPENISMDEAVFIEPIAACIRSFEIVPFRPEDNLVILGPGPIGLLSMQIAKNYGIKKIIVLGTKKDRLKLAEELGADLTINVSEENYIERVLKETNGIGADIVIEATGNPNGISEAIKLVRSRGKIIVKTTCGQYSNINATELVVREIELIGTRCGPFDKAIDMLANNKIEVLKLISHKFKLENIMEAFKLINEKKALKILIEI